MSDWKLGDTSTVHRFEKRKEGGIELLVELEDYNGEEVEVRLYESSSNKASESVKFESLTDAIDYIREEWNIDADAFPGTPTVRVKRSVLSLLADYAGSDAVFGHEVPAEVRDAIQAAYEALDESRLSLSFYDCPEDGTPLDPLHDPDLPVNEEQLKCPECGKVYLLDQDQGTLERF